MQYEPYKVTDTKPNDNDIIMSRVGQIVLCSAQPNENSLPARQTVSPTPQRFALTVLRDTLRRRRHRLNICAFKFTNFKRFRAVTKMSRAA